MNTNKLKARYPEKFTEDKAINRNLDKEREVLEKQYNFSFPNSDKEVIEKSRIMTKDQIDIEKLYDNCIEEDSGFRSIE